MKKDTYMTLLGFRDTCYNDFNFDIDEKDVVANDDLEIEIEENENIPDSAKLK